MWGSSDVKAGQHLTPADPTGDGTPLDELLLETLDRWGEGWHDVLAELRRVDELSLRFRDDRCPELLQSRRVDTGVALRRVDPSTGTARQLSAPDVATARCLLRGQEPPPPAPAQSDETDPARLDAKGLTAALDGLAVDEGARLELRASVTDVTSRVLTSEWGERRRRRAWCRVVLELEHEGRRFRRGIGATERPSPQMVRHRAEELVATARTHRSDDRQAPASGPAAVVLSPAATAVLVHEAVGHALEGDVASRDDSALWSAREGLSMGRPITVVDDPTRSDGPACWHHDDEGVLARPATLVEEGRVVGCVHDLVSAGFDPRWLTGHARRASPRDPILPRLSNTALLGADAPVDELLHELREGLLIEQLSGGHADPRSGELRLVVAEGRRVEDGRPTAPLEPCVLVGRAADVLAGIRALGDDFAWDDGTATCGRHGQWLPVSAGGPSLLLAKGALTVA
ncbi:MAG: TldD/PmbA family protein [Acidobacteriota bacterium]